MIIACYVSFVVFISQCAMLLVCLLTVRTAVNKQLTAIKIQTDLLCSLLYGYLNILKRI